MSLPVTTDLAFNPTRVLDKLYDAGTGALGGGLDSALGTGDPNTLHTNRPTVEDAFGIVPENGIVSFIQTGAAVDVTIWVWNGKLLQVSSAAGKAWVKVGESAALNTKNIAQYALASFKAPPNQPYYLQGAAAAAREVITHDAGPAPKADGSDNTNHTYDML